MTESRKMFFKALLLNVYLSAIYFWNVGAQRHCTDLSGRAIGHGLHYVPGPETCRLCICDNGLPQICKEILCSQPQDCRSFRVGNSCCEYICLDDVVKPVESTETNVRLAAGGAAAVVLLSVALVVYRVRKKKQRRSPHADDQRSLTSIGYISGSMGYMGGTCETALGAWKPPGNYLPRGEAPPPYEEAVAQYRLPVTRLTNDICRRTYPTTLEPLVRHEEPMQYIGHGYMNISRPIQQIANTQNCYNAPLLTPEHPPEFRERGFMQHHSIQPNEVPRVSVVGVTRSVRLTGSLGAISSRLVPATAPMDNELLPAYSAHRTIPRISTALEPASFDNTIAMFHRGDRSLHNEIRRSFHKPGENIRHYDTGRSMPRNLNLASIELRQEQTSSENRIVRENESHAQSTEELPRRDSDVTAAVAPPTATTTLPLTVDKPSCVCSYEGSNAPDGEDTDDFRNECENCKSASSSKWAVQEGWHGEEEEGTQTLQRHQPATGPPPPVAATLPQRGIKQGRTVMGPPSNWENWFNTIPDSDTESEDE